MALDLAELAKRMSAAFLGSLKKDLPEIHHYANGEAQKFAQSFATIEKLFASKTIDEEEARLHVEIQKNASRIVFLTIEGLGALAVEQAINAGLAVIREMVNSALKFTLL